MSDRRLIGRHATETPPHLRTSPGRVHEMPPDLLRQASRRLQIVCLVGAGLWLLGTIAFNVSMDAVKGCSSVFEQTNRIAFFGCLESLTLYLFLRIRDPDPEVVMHCGLAHLVLTAFVLGPLAHWIPPTCAELQRGTYPIFTWIAPVMLMFAALLPTRPWKMGIACTIAAAMDPLGMLVANANHMYQIKGNALAGALTMHYVNFLMVGVAVVISRVVSRLGEQVGRARELGSYRLGELLGRGGMGEVYRATHRMLARPAAIKLIRPEVLALSGEESAQTAIARFHREAEAAANLRSPHTVELYDFGVTDDETLYFVMELLDGMDLESLVRAHGPVAPRRVIHIIGQVCQSLAEAHAGGQIHRDIKPANIHIGRLGLEHDFVKVLDFGLVKSVAAPNSPSTPDSLATAAGTIPGTPAYMAPEMVAGDHVDGRADLYAVGCVAYYLLTGKLVFESASPLQSIAKHLRETPVPPSLRADVRVPPALEQLVMACLEKKPENRPPDAIALRQQLGDLGLEPWSQDEAIAWWNDVGSRPSVSPAPVPA